MFEFNLLPSRRIKRLLPGVLLIATCYAVGCSKDDVKKMAASVQKSAASLATSAKEKATQAVQQVEKQLPATGEITLQLSPPLEIPAANVSVISIGDGRKNVVQIASYDVTGAPKTYPSILIQGNTTAADPASLAGQSVLCELYVQESGVAPIAMNAAGKLVNVKFTSFDPQKKTISANIAAADLVRADNNPLNLNGGTIIAVVTDGGS